MQPYLVADDNEAADMDELGELDHDAAIIQYDANDPYTSHIQVCATATEP